MPKKEIKKIPPTKAELLQKERPYLVKEALIKDDFCNYSYEIIDGIGIGDTHNVKGSGIVHEDMRNAFSFLNVHLAVIDDAFKFSKYDIKNIEKEYGHEITLLYHVTGFKIRGSEESESVILIGSKSLSTGGRMELETPKIAIDDLSSYKWRNELKSAIDNARLEVALYKEGWFIPVEEDDEPDHHKQTKIKFSVKDNSELDPDFVEAAL